jgi:hypothetical protein
MRIFVAYGYNPRDRWIEEMVFPIIKSFDSEVVTGEKAYGERISDLVCSKIRTCDALIAFMTRRGNYPAANGQTHWWVLQELGIGYANKLQIVEVREQGVDRQEGIAQGFQRIEYEETQREKCLIEIVEAVGALHLRALVRIQLLPESLAERDLRHRIKDHGLLCTYVVQRGNKKEEAVPTQITSMRGGLFIDAPRVSGGDLLQINITHGTKEWSTSFGSTDYYLKLQRSGSMLQKVWNLLFDR